MAEGILPGLVRRYVHLDSIAVTMATCVAAVVAMVERRGCLHGSVCSHIAHTNCLYRGHPAEKGHLHLRRISWLRLHWTSSDDLKLFRFPLALSIPHRVTSNALARAESEGHLPPDSVTFSTTCTDDSTIGISR